MSWPPREKKQTGLFEFIFGSEAGFFLIVINVILYIFFRYTYNGQALLDVCVLYPANVFQERNFICLVTSGFIHANTSHLFWNMLGIFVFSRIVDKHLGAGKMLFIYFGSLVISMFLSIFLYTYVFHQNIAIIGASGAVMGLIAAAMLLDPFAVTYEMFVPLPVMVKGWIFFLADLKGLLNAERDQVSHLVHLIGFLSIAILVYFLSEEDKKSMFKGLLVNVFSFFALLVFSQTPLGQKLLTFGQ